jgi:hypothetical protein
MGMVATAFVMLEASLKAQLLLLQLIQAFVGPLLLPAGIILRFFPPTRDAGAFIIAVAIGFYIVFPLTYVINKVALDQMGFKYDETTRPKALLYSLCGGDLFFATIPTIAIPAGGGVFSSGLKQMLAVTLNPLLSQGPLLLFKVNEFMVIVDSMTVLSLMGFFAPAISMVFTVAFINALTKFIVLRG